MKVRSRYEWRPEYQVLSLAQAFERECDSYSRDQIERAQQTADKAVEKLSDLVTLLMERGVLQPRDIEALLPSYEVVE